MHRAVVTPPVLALALLVLVHALACAPREAREVEPRCPGEAVFVGERCLVDLDPGEPVPDDIHARWDEVWGLLELGYGAFAAKPELDWAEVLVETHDALDEVETLYAAEDTIARAVARLDDGHTYLQPDTVCALDPGFGARLTNTGACLVEVEDDEGRARFFVNEASAASGLELGDEVLAVNGRSVEALLADLEAQPRCIRRASTAAQARLQLVESVMFFPTGAGQVWLRRDGEVRVQPLALADPARCTGRARPPGIERDETGLEVAELEGGARYVHLPRFGADVGEGFEAAPMLAAVRGALTALPDEGLVLDLRGNTGGFTTVAELIAGALSREGITLQTCQARAPDGSFGEPFTVRAEPDAAIRYAGPVAVITDALSFSAADFLAHGLGPRSGRATTVGAPSAGGFGNGFFGLAGGWLVGLSSVLCVDDEGAPLEGAPPPPEVPAAHSAEALAEGRDAVIEAAVAALAP